MGKFKRFCMIVFVVAAVLGIGVLAALWFAWEPLFPAIAWLMSMPWFFVVEAVLLGITALGLLVVVLTPLSAPIDSVVHSNDESQPHATQEQVRVRADLLDRLVNNAGEVAIYRARLEQQLGAFRGAMAELDRTNTRLHDQLRRLDLETEAQIVARYQREQDKRGNL